MWGQARPDKRSFTKSRQSHNTSVKNEVKTSVFQGCLESRKTSKLFSIQPKAVSESGTTILYKIIVP